VQVGVNNWQTIAVVNCQKMVRGGGLRFFLASKIDLGANVRWMIANGGKIWKNGIQPGRVGILHGDLMEYQDYFKEFGRLSNRIVMYEMRKLVSLSAFCVQAFQEPFSWVTIDTEIGFRNTAKTLLAAGM